MGCFFSSRRRHTRFDCDWSSDVCSSDLGALTSHGVAWGSLTLRLRDLAVKGHLPKREAARVKQVFAAAAPEQARILVLHHNVLRGEISRRMGLARWRRAQRRIVETGAELVLCGHDHQEGAEQLQGRVVVSTAGAPSTRTPGGPPSSFNFLTIQPSAGAGGNFPGGAEGREVRA